MKTIPLISAAIAAMLAATAPATPAQALMRTFVSAAGSGNTCSRTAPCATFQAAHDVTDSGGQINCLDAGDFAPIFINRHITIDCTGTFGASILAVLGNGVIVASGLTVRLRNLAIEGNGPLAGSLGVLPGAGGTLFLENCVITKFQDAVQLGASDGQVSNVILLDTKIDNIGNRAIAAQASGSGAIRILLDGVRIERAANIGIEASGTHPATGSISVQIRNSVLTGNSRGIYAHTTAGGDGTVVGVTLDRSSSLLNTDGIDAEGPTTFVLVGRSAVLSNSTGLNPISGGHILSYQNNHLNGNATNGAPTSVLTMK